MKLTLFVIGLLSMIVFTTVRIVNYVHFSQDIGGCPGHKEFPEEMMELLINQEQQRNGETEENGIIR